MRPGLPPVRRRARALHPGGRERVVLDGHDRVAARGERPDAPLVVDVQADPGAPAGAVVGVRASRTPAGRISTGTSTPPKPLERIGQHLELEGALVRQLDVPEVRAARPRLRRHVDVGLAPDVRAPVRRRVQDLERLPAPERLLADIRQPRPHPLAGDRVRNEDDPALVARDEDAAVGDVRHVEVEDVAGARGRGGR